MGDDTFGNKLNVWSVVVFGGAPEVGDVEEVHYFYVAEEGVGGVLE